MVSSAGADEQLELLENINAENRTRNVGHNENVGKGSTEAKVDLEQAPAIWLHASLVDSLKGEATVESTAICVICRNGADASTRPTGGTHLI